MKKVYEDAPTVNIGGGDIAGAGVSKAGKASNWAEPGVSPRHQPKGSKTTKTSVILGYFRRKAPNQLAEISKETLKSYIEKHKAEDKSYVKRLNVDSREDPTRKDYARASSRHTGYNLAHQKLGKRQPGKRSKIVPKVYATEETFAGAVVFEVSSSTFHNAKMEKRKGKHWRTYLDECDELTEIRNYANKNPGKPIVLQNRTTNEMVYVRYGKRK